MYRLEKDIAPKEKILDPLWWRGEFFRILTVAFFRVNECSTGLKPLAGTRNRRKVTMKIRRNPSRYQSD